MDLVVTSFVLSHGTARTVVDRCMKQAAQMGVNVAVAVVDPAGHLVCFERMDGTALLCCTLAQDKAHTVAVFGLPTHQWWDVIGDDPALMHGIVKTERLVVFGGGVPIAWDGRLVGAVGVSGGTASQDQEIAEAGAAALAAAALDSSDLTRE